MSAADRQRRYREKIRQRAERHAADDHEMCRAPECEVAQALAMASQGVTRDVTPPSADSRSRPSPPADMGPRGERLWAEMAGLKLTPGHVLLLERACRQADRLDRLDRQVIDREWIELVEVPGTQGGRVEVVVDRLLNEIRQLELALKQNVAELRLAGRPAEDKPAVPGGPKVEGAAGGGGSSDARPGGNVRSIAGLAKRPQSAG